MKPFSLFKAIWTGTCSPLTAGHPASREGQLDHTVGPLNVAGSKDRGLPVKRDPGCWREGRPALASRTTGEDDEDPEPERTITAAPHEEEKVRRNGWRFPTTTKRDGSFHKLGGQGTTVSLG